MRSFFTARSSKQKRAARIQLVALTAALLLALVVLPVSADHEAEAEYSCAYDEATAASSTGSSDADSARLAALGEYYTAKSLEASNAAFAARYQALAASYDQAGGVVVAQDAEELAKNPELKSASTWGGVASAAADSGFLAENPETKYASGWGGASAGAAATVDNSANPELSAFQGYCGC